ncbi:hypothetical protein [Microbulbifer sp. YPW1]|uniref:hypothetical protein n=1 Tax=Microbulbifer sp. YPW1 TaxID=2745199 RepID=UPI0015983235|nr:hypothetical protein [Microbulbifer sp. YPW1]QKX17754.1 hypothetical protein HUW35_12650 [Microbulbifer sp. YPW1]
MEVKLKIYRNKIELSNGSKIVSESSKEAFSTQRLLVANFDAAWNCLVTAEKKLSIKGLFKRKPKVVVEPKELIEGGISQVEDRIFRELSMALNPKSVEIRA